MIEHAMMNRRSDNDVRASLAGDLATLRQQIADAERRAGQGNIYAARAGQVELVELRHSEAALMSAVEQFNGQAEVRGMALIR